jgi:3-phytase/alkaline phosphatase D
MTVPRRVLSTALAAAVLITAVQCGPRRPAVSPEARPGIAALELVGEFNIPPLPDAAPLKAARFGGVSGLAIDPVMGDLLGVCDDRAEPRVFVFRPPRFTASSPFRIDLHAYFPLPPGADGPSGLDPEGIAISRGGRLFVSSEGIQNQEPRVPPAIVEYTRNYQYVRRLAVPDKFVPPATGPIATGVRNNAAFESLTLTPDDRRLYTAAESPLAQDGPEAGIGRAGLVRIIEYEERAGLFELARELPYPLEPFPPTAFTPGYLVTGIVELLSLGGTEFLAMERGYAEEAGEKPRSVNHIRIYRMSIDGATDVSRLASMKDGPDLVRARKTLLLDLSTVKGLSPELAGLDNFEGMVFGPRLPDGSRTLLIVSDDNFNRRQRTSFLLFRVVEG